MSDWTGLAHCPCCPRIMTRWQLWQVRRTLTVPLRPIQQHYHCDCCVRLRAGDLTTLERRERITWLDTPDQARERRADEAQQRSEWRQIDAIETKKRAAWWRHLLDE